MSAELKQGESSVLSSLLPQILSSDHGVVRFKRSDIKDLYDFDKYYFVNRLKDIEKKGLIDLQTIDDNTYLIVKLKCPKNTISKLTDCWPTSGNVTQNP